MQARCDPDNYRISRIIQVDTCVCCGVEAWGMGVDYGGRGGGGGGGIQSISLQICRGDSEYFSTDMSRPRYDGATSGWDLVWRWNGLVSVANLVLYWSTLHKTILHRLPLYPKPVQFETIQDCELVYGKKGITWFQIILFTRRVNDLFTRWTAGRLQASLLGNVMSDTHSALLKSNTTDVELLPSGDHLFLLHRFLQTYQSIFCM